jgi:hypothetical protein
MTEPQKIATLITNEVAFVDHHTQKLSLRTFSHIQLFLLHSVRLDTMDSSSMQDISRLDSRRALSSLHSSMSSARQLTPRIKNSSSSFLCAFFLLFFSELLNFGVPRDQPP